LRRIHLDKKTPNLYNKRVQIDDTLIAYLEDLSCLTLSADEKTRLTGDLQKIVDYMARLGELDTNGVSERSHPFDDVNAFRDDTVRPSFERALILQNAPARNDEFTIAPKTVE
jgi:aspartyl-tRNA(Asn)/glutamyl-tRNA(Gln) amidotransferase subunit C